MFLNDILPDASTVEDYYCKQTPFCKTGNYVQKVLRDALNIRKVPVTRMMLGDVHPLDVLTNFPVGKTQKTPKKNINRKRKYGESLQLILS